MTGAGLPHSDTLGSQLGWQLPEAYRSLPRPSSAPDAKTSTVYPYTLTTTQPKTIKDARIHYALLKEQPHTTQDNTPHTPKHPGAQRPVLSGPNSAPPTQRQKNKLSAHHQETPTPHPPTTHPPHPPPTPQPTPPTHPTPPPPHHPHPTHNPPANPPTTHDPPHPRTPHHH